MFWKWIFLKAVGERVGRGLFAVFLHISSPSSFRMKYGARAEKFDYQKQVTDTHSLKDMQSLWLFMPWLLLATLIWVLCIVVVKCGFNSLIYLLFSIMHCYAGCVRIFYLSDWQLQTLWDKRLLPSLFWDQLLVCRIFWWNKEPLENSDQSINVMQYVHLIIPFFHFLLSPNCIMYFLRPKT